ncbi:MAG: type II secretion system F family protein [Actinomycetota bacterium]
MADPPGAAVIVAVLSSVVVVVAFATFASTPPARPVGRGRSRVASVRVGRWRLGGAHLAAMGVAAASVVLVGPVATVLLTLLVLLGRWWSGRRAAAAVLDAREAAVPELVELLAVALRSGASPAAAIERVSLVTGELPARPVQIAADRIRSGLPAGAAWSALADLPGAGSAIADLLDAADRRGAPIADAMADLATTARDDRRRRLETSVQRLPVLLLGPLVLCVLPSFVLLVCVPIVVGGLSGVV